jgi:fatty acid-binding protein DegV
MDFQIVADSCCDLTPEIKKQWGVTTVPLTPTDIKPRAMRGRTE